MKKIPCILVILLAILSAFSFAAADEQILGTFEFPDSNYPGWCRTCDIDLYTGCYTETSCWYVCPQCNERDQDTALHESRCDAPDTCILCGISGVTISNVYCTREKEVIGWNANYHWSQCEYCGDFMFMPERHWADCQAPGVCEFCQADDVAIMYTSHAEAELKYDDVQHWWQCLRCGEMDGEPSPHSHSCNRTSCYECGQENVTFASVSHHFDWTSAYVKVNDTKCTRTCTDCGALSPDVRDHQADCSAPGLCLLCGESDIIAQYSHEFDGSEYAYDQDHHWRVCSVCGGQFDKEQHGSFCSDLSSCWYCHAEGVNVTIKNHGDAMSGYIWDSFVPRRDNTHCWMECEICGAKEAVTRHYTNDCSRPDVCSDCGSTGVDCVVYHSYEAFDTSGGHFYIGTAQFDENCHWWVCETCGNKAAASHEFNASFLCTVCGYQGEGSCTHQDAGRDYVPFDDDYHHIQCADCGSILATDCHVAACTDPKVCKDCGAVDIWVYDTQHADTTKVLFDEHYHWEACVDCREILDANTAEPHVLDGNGACTICLYGRCEHYWDSRTYTPLNATEHQTFCGDCGIKMDVQAHYASCSNPTVCLQCGAEGIIADDLQHKEYVMLYDEYYHWEACADCGLRFDRLYGHEAECSSPDTCYYCDAVGVHMEELWHDDPEYSHDQYYHWRTCTLCGEKTWYEPHNALCSDPEGVCWACDATDVTIRIDHSQNVDFKYLSATQHQPCCTRCGEPLGDSQNHLADCDAPNKCIQCEAEGVTAEYAHEIDWNEAPEYDSTHHWYTCALCGERAGLAAHETNCLVPTTCSYCDAAGVTCIVYHGYDCFDMGEHSKIGAVFSNEEGHWWHCIDCGDETLHPHEYGSGTFCEVCLYEKPVSPVILPGDASGDGTTDIFDALAILQYAVGWGTEIDMSAADVNDDGECDIFDALLVLQYAVGWDVELK